MPAKKKLKKKIYILDTSSLIVCSDALMRFKSNDVYISITTLDELDGLKICSGNLGMSARIVIRTLEKLIKKGDLKKGVRISSRRSKIFCKIGGEKLLPKDLDPKVPDNKILGTALLLREENPEYKIILVSQDIAMRIKAESLGIKTEKIEVEAAVVNKKEQIYSGTESIVIDDEIMERFFAGEQIYFDEEDMKRKKIKLFPNIYITLISSISPKKTTIAKFQNYNTPLKKLIKVSKRGIYGLKPRNREQNFCIDALMNPDIKIVTIIGKSGCGKTLLSLACGLAQVINEQKETPYKKLIVSKPIIPAGGLDLGAMPGTKNEKLSYWLAPFADNLEYLLGDSYALQDLVERSVIEMESIQYLRGRSMNSSIVILDECQGVDRDQVKLITTRIGENSKLILLGDIEQREHMMSHINEVTNGLTIAVEAYKPYELSAHVTMVKGERSELATLSSRIL